MGPLNRPATKLHSKWSKLYQFGSVKVVPTVEDPERRESLTVHVDRLAFSSPRHRDEFAQEPFLPFDVPFRSLSNSSLHELFGEAPLERNSMATATPLHDPTPTPGSLDFLDQPLAQGKREGTYNRIMPTFYVAYRNGSSEYSGARQNDIRRQQSRRVRVPPHDVDLNA